MLFEQAFMSLPEFLLGTPYSHYGHEGTLVTAYSMAILQELNGRNVNNPIACLRGEARYKIASSRRADIHLDLESMNVLNDALTRYCIKQHNWLEAKFWRLNDAGKPTVDRVKAVLLMLKDLIRLSVFPDEPLSSDSDSISARYLLHGYQSDPKKLLAFKKNSKNGIPGFTRSWTSKIRIAGEQNGLKSFNLDREVTQFDGFIGAKLRELTLSLDVTNFAYVPCNPDPQDYWLYLTRLDTIGMEHDGVSFEIAGGCLTESVEGSYETIGQFVAENMAA